MSEPSPWLGRNSPARLPRKLRELPAVLKLLVLRLGLAVYLAESRGAGYQEHQNGEQEDLL